jgi:hypothetical protein
MGDDIAWKVLKLDDEVDQIQKEAYDRIKSAIASIQTKSVI